ncbi:NAD(P)-dependent dehydrogenase (short-subunit alcohol dehydrogenase family) [Rhodanobacter sp. MP1X3]|nr:NAD(P)-dependent dehydrogenase (short-subunit alcohol dehydrogenase family) [Rhodanobacter sp. MP1X3]
MIDVTKSDHYQRLLNDLKRDGCAIDCIVHAFNLDGSSEESWSYDPAAMDKSLYSVLYLVQALGDRMPGHPITLNLLARHVALVLDGDKVCPERAVLTGISRVIPHEFANVTCRVLDVGDQATRPGRVGSWEEDIARDVVSESMDAQVAWRGSQRWIRIFEQVTPGNGTAPSVLRERGVYFVTGGLGGIGMAIAEHLAQAVQARLVLVSRRVMPPRANWASIIDAATDNELCTLIRRIERMETLGAEVLLACADIADQDQVREATLAAVGRFGAIHGVIHAAGVAGDSMITTKTRSSVAAVLRPKVDGTVELARAMQVFEPEFFVLCSSMSAVNGGVGQYDYAAANAFQDAFAVRMDGVGRTHYVSIGWAAWKEVGMAANMRLPAYLLAEKEQQLKSAIGTDEGVRALMAILADPLPHWIVSPRDLAGTLEAARPNSGLTGAVSRPLTPTNVQPRQELTTTYIEPDNQIEEVLVGVWQELLSIDRVGVADNFFELGGDSILIIRLHTMMRNQLPELMREVPLKLLFEHPTVAGIGAVLAERYEALHYAGEVKKMRETTLIMEVGEI